MDDLFKTIGENVNLSRSCDPKCSCGYVFESGRHNLTSALFARNGNLYDCPKCGKFTRIYCKLHLKFEWCHVEQTFDEIQKTRHYDVSSLYPDCMKEDVVK